MTAALVPLLVLSLSASTEPDPRQQVANTASEDDVGAIETLEASDGGTFSVEGGLWVGAGVSAAVAIAGVGLAVASVGAGFAGAAPVSWAGVGLGLGLVLPASASAAQLGYRAWQMALARGVLEDMERRNPGPAAR